MTQSLNCSISYIPKSPSLHVKMSIFHDEVEIEDFEYDDETEEYKCVRCHCCFSNGRALWTHFRKHLLNLAVGNGLATCVRLFFGLPPFISICSDSYTGTTTADENCLHVHNHGQAPRHRCLVRRFGRTTTRSSVLLELALSLTRVLPTAHQLSGESPLDAR
jgi:hypothetical protein